jgi:hypothetical protein
MPDMTENFSVIVGCSKKNVADLSLTAQLKLEGDTG